jgi:hypothetical protein
MPFLAGPVVKVHACRLWSSRDVRVISESLVDHGLATTDLVDHEVPIRERQVSRTTGRYQVAIAVRFHVFVAVQT